VIGVFFKMILELTKKGMQKCFTMVLIASATLLITSVVISRSGHAVENSKEVVSRIREQCEAILYQASRNENAFIRSAAYRSAGESGDPELIPILKQGTEDVYPTARQFALKGLRFISPKEAVASAEKMIGDSDIWVRSLAIETLGEEGGSEFVQIIEEYLKDPDHTVRLSAAEALVKLGHENYLSFLIEYIDHTRLRKEAISRLGSLTHLEAKKKILEMLNDPDPQTIYYALKALKKHSSIKPVPKLRELIHHSHPSVRKEAVGVMGGLQTEGTEALLQGVCSDGDAMVRLAAAVALYRLNSKACRAEFARALKNPDYGVRSASARILGKVDLPGRGRLLVRAIGDENVRVRSAAVRAVGMMGGPQALPLLLKVLRDPQEVIRAYAAGNLMKLLMVHATQSASKNF
tara:strand:- start:3013 stop:4233 length:1221 start_codon:yes stop_codon:yes gene_type:complete